MSGRIPKDLISGILFLVIGVAVLIAIPFTIQDVARGRKIRTTMGDEKAVRQPDPVNREFSADARISSGGRFHICGDLEWIRLCGIRD